MTFNQVSDQSVQIKIKMLSNNNEIWCVYGDVTQLSQIVKLNLEVYQINYNNIVSDGGSVVVGDTVERFEEHEQFVAVLENNQIHVIDLEQRQLLKTIYAKNSKYHQ